MNPTPEIPGQTKDCPKCQTLLAADATQCPACGWSVSAAETGADPAAVSAPPPKRLPAWGLIVALLLPALLTAATARSQSGAAIGFALVGSAAAALYTAVWIWLRMTKSAAAKLFASVAGGACCGFVALMLSAFGCALGGFKMDFR